MIYEERRIQIKSRCFQNYRDWALTDLWGQLESSGHRPLCLLNGMIGKTAEDVVLVTGYKDFNAWKSAQPLLAGESRQSAPREWVDEEQVKLLEASSYRPDPETPKSDRRPVYGMRRWWIDPNDWPEFNRLSYEGVWPALDHMGHYVMGQFRDMATTSTLEILNLAGYHDPSHWQATRDPAAQGVPAELIEKYNTIGRDRRQLVLRSFVCLMAAHWPD